MKKKCRKTKTPKPDNNSKLKRFLKKLKPNLSTLSLIIQIAKNVHDMFK